MKGRESVFLYLRLMKTRRIISLCFLSYISRYHHIIPISGLRHLVSYNNTLFQHSTLSFMYSRYNVFTCIAIFLAEIGPNSTIKTWDFSNFFSFKYKNWGEPLEKWEGEFVITPDRSHGKFAARRQISLRTRTKNKYITAINWIVIYYLNIMWQMYFK